MGLERLPPELISQVLRNIDSPRHLYRLLSASPVCLHIFSRSPNIVLSSVIKNTIPANALHHYLVLLNVPTWTGNLDVWVREQLPPFLELYSKPIPFSWPTDKAGLHALCRIHNRLSYFLNGYLENVSIQLHPATDNKYTSNFDGSEKNYSHDHNTAPPPLPSESENARLQRGFLRFELYCRVFSAHQEGWECVVVSPADQFNLFLARLQPWEVVEICCVHQYFACTVDSYIKELEDKFVTAVLDAPGAITPTAPSLQYSLPDTPQTPNKGDQNLVSIKNLDLGDLSLFSEDWNYRMPRRINSIISLGFDFLYELMRTTETRRAEMILANHHIFQTFLPEALQDDPISEIATIQSQNEEDDPFSVSLGYQLFGLSEEGFYIGILDHGISYALLRHLGYVFWDSDRIRHPFINEKLRQAKEAKWDELERRFERSHHKSAEERLAGVLLPRKERSRLEGEFGSTLSIHLQNPKARGIRYFGEAWFDKLAADKKIV